MNWKTSIPALFLAPLFVSFSVLAEEPIRLLQIRGGSDVSVKRGTSILRLKAGNPLQGHDEITTDDKSGAAVQFPDGSLFWIGRATTAQVNQTANGLQVVGLKSGQVRILVRHQGTPGAVAGKIKFLLRTKAATLGVRGTEFVVDANAKTGGTELHTLDGVVEAAKNDEGMKQGKTVNVGVGTFVKLETGRPLPEAREFDTRKYLAELAKQQPEISALENLAAPGTAPRSAPGAPPPVGAARPDNVRQHMEQLNQQREHELERKSGE